MTFIKGFDGLTPAPEHEDAVLCREALEMVERHAATLRAMEEARALQRREFTRRFCDAGQSLPRELTAEEREIGREL